MSRQTSDTSRKDQDLTDLPPALRSPDGVQPRPILWTMVSLLLFANIGVYIDFEAASN